MSLSERAKIDVNYIVYTYHPPPPQFAVGVRGRGEWQK
jgi:hypothetical protein